MIKIAIVVSHPIQHFCPQYASFAKLDGIKLKVLFGSRLGLDAYKDEQFNMSIKWNNLYLDEFDHTFLNNEVLQPDKNIDSTKLEIELSSFYPDYIIIYGYFQKLQKRAYRWAVNNRVKLLYISDSELLMRRKFGVMYLKKLYLDKYFSEMSAFLTVGDSNELYYKYYNVPLQKMSRTFFPIDIRIYEQAISGKEIFVNDIIRKHELSKDDFILCTVGKLIPIKKQSDVINAIKKLSFFRERRIVYFIIGDGSDKAMLEARAQEVSFHKIIFTGFTKPEELPSYYLASDLYVHPSEVEPHSLAISEAIYSGCPVLISDRCGSYGPTDDVQEGFNGFVYECGNTLILSKYIKLLIENHELLNELSANSRKLAINHQHLAHGQGLFNAINATRYTL